MFSTRIHARFRCSYFLLALASVYVTLQLLLSSSHEPQVTLEPRSLPRGHLDDLLIADGRAINHYVHFVETSGNKTRLAPREACAFESAARAHPDSNVILYVMNTSYDLDDPFLLMLRREFKNFAILDFDLDDLFNSTPLADWYKSGGLNRSKFPAHHLSDALRFALLYKYGGVYQDTDSITLRSMRGLLNAVALESSTGLGCGVLVFPRHAPFVRRCLSEFVRGYDGASWGAQGPEVVTRVARADCNVRGDFNLTDVTRCPEVNVHPLKTFYAIPLRQLFKRMWNRKQLDFPDNYYAAHTWASQSQHRKAFPGSGTVIDVLFQRKCPSAYQIMEWTGAIQGVPNKCLLYQNDQL